MNSKSVNRLIEQGIRNNWERAALSNYKGITYTYGEMAVKIEKLHIAFSQLGIVPGDKIALCSKNQADWGIVFLAILTYGAVPVPLLHEFKSGNIHFLVNHSDSKLIFVDTIIAKTLVKEDMPALMAAIRINEKGYSVLFAKDAAVAQVWDNLDDSFNSSHSDGFTADNLHYYPDTPEQLAIISYTSGTSGFSKGVMIPYRAFYSNITFAYWAEPHIGPGSRMLSMLPSAHMYGMMFDFLFAITLGAHIVFITRTPSPQIVLTAFKDIKPCLVISVPLVIEKIYKSKLKNLADRSRPFFHIPLLNSIVKGKICTELKKAFGGEFEEVILGGAAFNPDVEKFFHEIHFPYTVGYGMTECAPIISYAHWDKTKVFSCGKAAPGMKIRIDSKNPNEEPGEVQVQGENVFLGYYKDETATKNSFTEDGWFRTGDIGILDSDGFLFLKGRSKDMILGASGQNIYPEEIEAVINNLNYVSSSLVIEDGGYLIALVHPDYPKAEADGLSCEETEKMILGYLPIVNNEIPNYERIKRFEIMTKEFEMTPKKSIKRFIYKRN